MEFPTWSEIDEELDKIEEQDIVGIVAVFERYRGRVLVGQGRRERVTVSSFSRHIGMPRHTFNSWVSLSESLGQAG